ncbi:autotransporter outer membrane beta-barrel domain-containing protein [Kosakonia oryziphila]|uniref:Autotransporter family porin n=1 Tax=Kosakonia oryziphila TaxID=1005667 RepID=A0A1C4G617_9ENTR|nr:autotransporter outer membrane beta-barrel domain-containing protein [Kosakonia oryziphila]SCC63383.1 autotransporter family porin [Kosakonia oryziphila]
MYTPANTGGSDVTFNQAAGTINANQFGLLFYNLGTGSSTVNLSDGTINATYAGIDVTTGSTVTDTTLTQSSSHTVNSASRGIELTHNGTGNANITLAGTTNAGLVGGFFVLQTGSSGNMNITQTGGSISGGACGLLVQNGSQSGAININTSGSVIGTNSNGIGVLAMSLFTDKALSLTQSGGDISGGSYGVFFYNLGHGAANVTQTTGSISGAGGDGLYITNGYNGSPGGTDITVTVADRISGTQNGISVYNYGSGQTSITSSGMIRGEGTTVPSTQNPISGDGIYAFNDASATDLVISQTAGSILGSTNGIEAINNGTTTTTSIAGTVTGGTGAGIDTSGTANTVSIILNSGALVSATSGVAVRDGAGNATLTMNNGSRLVGQVLLGEGNDAMIIKGTADISGATVLDGGNSTDAAVTDILGTATAATNTLTFENTSQSLAGSIMKNWETVTLTGSDVTFSGDAALVTGSGSSQQGLVIQNSSTLSSPVALDVTGDVSIDATSTLNHSLGGTLTGNVTNAGLIKWQNTIPGQTLTINGNYTGETGSLLALNTVLGDDSSVTDKLVITGDSAGTTAVRVSNAGGSGAPTLNGIELIHINGISSGEFTQAGRIVAGAYEYSLGRGQGSNSSNWYLTNRRITQIPVIESEVNTPSEQTFIVGDISAPDLRPEGGSYTANMAAANTLFNTRLHDRLGETQYIDALTGEKKVTSMWLRQIGEHNNWHDGSGQLKTQDNRYVIQLGGDVAQWSTDGLDRLHLGLMAGYGYGSSHTRSSVTGYGSKGTLDGYSLGVYATWYANDVDHNGLYIDSWAQYGWFNNHVHGDELAQESYKSRGLTASVESGYSYKLGEFAGSLGSLNAWYIQPQAQITWMGVKADDHREDNGTLVQGEGDGNIQTRLGVRTYLKGHNKMDDEKGREFQPFIEVNWLHNTRNFASRMNGVSISQAGARNLGEVKLGVEGQINPHLNLWGNVGVQIGDKGYNDSVAMVGFKVNF